MPRTLARRPALVLLSLLVAVPGCASEQQVQQLKKRVDALEKQNAELQRRLDAVDKGGGAGSPLGSIGGLVGLIGQLAKNARPRTPPSGGAAYGARRSTALDPALQQRLDQLLVEGLEKLAKSDDAKALIKTMLQALRRNVEAGKGAGSLPLPITAPPGAQQKQQQR